MRKIVIFTGSCHHINGVMRTMLRYLQLYKEPGDIYRQAHAHVRTQTDVLSVSKESVSSLHTRTHTRRHTGSRVPYHRTYTRPLTESHGKERKVDRTAQRAEIKGRRGDEFVKKAEAGQQHASRTSKRQDEMKSNRCPSPSLLETFSSSLLAFPSSFLYPLSFLGHDFLLPPSAPFFFYLPLCLLSYSLRALHIRFNHRHSDSSPFSLFLLFSFSSAGGWSLSRARRFSKEQAGGKQRDKGGQNRGRGPREPFTRGRRDRVGAHSDTLFPSCNS